MTKYSRKPKPVELDQSAMLGRAFRLAYRRSENHIQTRSEVQPVARTTPTLLGAVVEKIGIALMSLVLVLMLLAVASGTIVI